MGISELKNTITEIKNSAHVHNRMEGTEQRISELKTEQKTTNLSNREKTGFKK